MNADRRRTIRSHRSPGSARVRAARPIRAAEMVDLHRVDASATHHDRSASYPRLACASLPCAAASHQRACGTGAIIDARCDPDAVLAPDHLLVAVRDAYARGDDRADAGSCPRAASDPHPTRHTDAARDADAAGHAYPEGDAGGTRNGVGSRKPDARRRGDTFYEACIYGAHAGFLRFANDRDAGANAECDCGTDRCCRASHGRGRRVQLALAHRFRGRRRGRVVVVATPPTGRQE